jgi:hypothetical protein
MISHLLRMYDRSHRRPRTKHRVLAHADLVHRIRASHYPSTFQRNLLSNVLATRSKLFKKLQNLSESKNIPFVTNDVKSNLQETVIFRCLRLIVRYLK